MRVLAAAGSVALYAAGAGVDEAGYDGVDALVAAVAAAVGGGLAYGLWRHLDKTVAGWVLGIVGTLALFASPRVAVLAALPMIAGVLAAKGSRHASDVAFVAVALAAVFAGAYGREWLAATSAFVLPALLLGGALLLREAWDLGDLAASARSGLRPLGDGSDAGAPDPGREARRELLRASLLVGMGVGLAVLVGTYRRATEGREVSAGSGALALMLLLAALAGVALLRGGAVKAR